MQRPEADRDTHSKPFIETQIAILMGGRVAEELFLRRPFATRQTRALAESRSASIKGGLVELSEPH